MARSRYTNSELVNGKFLTNFKLPTVAGGLKNIDLLDGVKTIEYVYNVGDRLDHLAAKFMGDDQYWWLIALVNNINYPFASGGLVPGLTLKIPTDPKPVLDKIMR